MKLDTPIYIAGIERDTPEPVWISPEVSSVQIERLPIVEITDTDQLLDIYGELNRMRHEAERRARELDERNSELLREVAALKARIYDLTGGRP